MLLNVSGNNIWSGSITSNTATSSQLSRVQSDLDKLTLSGTVSLTGSAHQLVFQGAGDFEISGQITGVGRITSSTTGAGIRTLSNDSNNYTGSTLVNGGTLAFTSIGNVGATSSALGAPVLADATILLGSTAAGTLRYVGTDVGGHTSDRVINLASTTFGVGIEANGAGPLVLSSALTATGLGSKTLTLSGNNIGNNSIGAIVNNSVTNTTALTKTGTGTWVLSGTNSYTGATVVNAGTLRVNGSTHSSSAFTVASGATLAGSGTVAGNVTVIGNVAPGNAGVGTLNMSADLNIADQAAGTGKLNFELASIAASDKIAVGGVLTIGTEVLRFDDFVFSPLSGLENGTYKLITGAASVVGSLDAANLANLTGTIGAGPAQGTLQFTGNDLELVVSGAGASDPFVSWSSGAPFGGDANSDGVANGLAWLLGAANPNVNATGLLPHVMHLPGGGLKINFSMRKSADRDGAVLLVEHSSDLGLADPWSAGVTVPEATGGSAPVTFTVDSSGALNVVEATISSSQAEAGKLFGRLKAQR
jgi:autotransporter-associated beta strand protein